MLRGETMATGNKVILEFAHALITFTKAMTTYNDTPFDRPTGVTDEEQEEIGNIIQDFMDDHWDWVADEHEEGFGRIVELLGDWS